MSKYSIQEFVDNEGNWDWENQHVIDSFSNSQDGTDSEFRVHDLIEAGTVLIAAGPATIEGSNKTDTRIDVDTKLVPIGLIEQAQVQQNKQLQHIFEIGSKISYIIPGRTIGNISLSRVFFDGPSLLKALYAGEVSEDGVNTDGDKKTAKFISDSSSTELESQFIGSGNFAINLASAFFDQPHGLCFFFRDRENQNVSQIYFEGCRIGTHSFSIHSQQNILEEAVTISFTRIVPVVTTSGDDGTPELWDKPIVGTTDS